jgi:predicted metal-dependent hydrolase
MHDITVRRIEFEFPGNIDPVFIEGQPEESYAIFAFSLLLPYLEPYLIRTMNAAKKHVADPELLKDMERFNAQEGQHYRQHRRFNEVMRTNGFERLPDFEHELDADYRRFTETKSLKFNLAYAEGFEAMTTAMARLAFETKSLERMHPAVCHLFSWHLIEELEHRTVAFEVYDHVCGDYFYRVAVGMFAQWHLLRFMDRVANYMLDADPQVLSRYGGVAGRKERVRTRQREFRRSLLPLVARTYSPWYTPENIEFTEELKVLARRYTEMAARSRPAAESAAQD